MDISDLLISLIDALESSNSDDAHYYRGLLVEYLEGVSSLKNVELTSTDAYRLSLILDKMELPI